MGNDFVGTDFVRLWAFRSENMSALRSLGRVARAAAVGCGGAGPAVSMTTAPAQLAVRRMSAAADLG